MPVEDKSLRQVKDVPVYHATLFQKEILKEGFKSREELGGRHKAGLGGASYDDLVSFTTSPVIARNIALDLQMMVDVAQGKITAKNVCEQLNQRDWHGDKLYGSAFNEKNNPCTIYEEYAKPGYEVNLETSRNFEHNKDVPQEELERMLLLDALSVSYLYGRNQAGGRPNPLIMGADIRQFGNPGINVGVVQATISLPQSVKYNASWNKYELTDLPPTLLNLWKNRQKMYHDYTSNIGNDRAPHRSPEFRTGDNFLRELKIPIKTVKCKIPPGKLTCENLAPFDIAKVAPADKAQLDAEWDDLTVAQYEGNEFWQMLYEQARDFGKEHPRKWWDGKMYPTTLDEILDDPDLRGEFLKEAEKDCVSIPLRRTPKVCKRLVEQVEKSTEGGKK